MKKTALFLVVMLVVSVFALSSCDLIQKIPFVGDLINKPCEEHVDANGDYICDKCEAELEKNDTPPTPSCEHKDENKDHKCDLCTEQLSECAAAEGSHNCPYCGKAFSECSPAEGSHNCKICGLKLSDCKAEDGSHNCKICGSKLSECKAEEGGHNCAICGEKFSDCSDADGDSVCDVCGGEVLPENMERVNYYLNISTLETGTLAADSINSKFTIVSGSEIRNRTKTFEGVEYKKSVKIGNATTMIKVDVPGNGKLAFLVQNGSSGAAMQFITVTAPDGTVHDIEFLGTDGGSPVLKIEVDVTPGEWVISRGKNGGTQDIFELSLSCIVEKSEENGFEIVSEGTVDYLCGQQLDLSGLRLNATFANGKTEPLTLDDVTVDTSLVNLGQSGTYAVTVSYKDYEAKSFNVNVYLPSEIELHFDAIEKLAQNSSAGNGVYFNHSFKEVYYIGEELDLTGLNVIVNGTLGEASKKFNVGNKYAIVYNTDDFTTAGEKIITVKYQFGEDEISANVAVHLVDVEPTVDPDTGSVRTLVDPDYLGICGELSGPFHIFTTIQQALDFLAKVDANTPKEIVIAPGYYREKLEITIPNLTIVGWGESPEDVVIEWDSLYGLVDAGGFTHTTDSTQTVAVRESAYNVTMENLTISNYWNSQERMDEAGLGIERGLALLVMSDRFVMRNSRLLGIQDTLELFTGRQYFENVYIAGYTDFIFGTNNTTYFKGCTIHVIDTSKDDSGTAGYLTAFKGSNKGSGDAIVYGAIFDQCKFTADEGVSEGKTAIGRTWGAYAAVAVINSDLGGHISVAGYDKAENKNKRYISMNGIHPTDETVQFVEYNNTGAGAITEAVAGMRFLTAEEAAMYADFSVIFGINNGKVSYLDPWNPESNEITVDDRDYYYFNGSSSSSGTSHTFDTTTTIASGSFIEWDGLTISAENGKAAWNQNANALNMKAGAFIKFTVPAGSNVTVETYPNYNFFTLNGVGTASANMLTQYYAEETEVILLSTGDLYLYSIIINPGEEAPAAATLTEIKASGMPINYIVGDELSYEGLKVLAYYSDNSVIEIKDFATDASAVNNAAEGKYDVLFSFGGKTASVTVNYEEADADPEITKNTYLDFKNEDGYNEVVNNERVTLDGSFRANGAEYQVKGTISFPVKAGTIVTVIPYGNSSYVSYTIGKAGEADLATHNAQTSTFFAEDCTVVYTGLDNNYLVGIQIVCPLKDGTYVFGGSGAEGDFTGILSSTENLVVSGTCKNHSGGAQLGQDSLISFTVAAHTTVTIQGFDTNYGQLDVLVDGVKIAMDDKACYVFTTEKASSVTIMAINVGTEEAPAWNKSYITSIDVKGPVILNKNTNVTFGSEGNYKDTGIDFSGIKVRDNGGNNSQINNGSFSFLVKAGATVTVNGYPGYTSYILSAGEFVSDTITDTTYTYTAEADVLVTITPVDGNNYFYSFSVSYPLVFDKNADITFGSEGNYKDSGIDFSGIKVRDNGGNNSQINNGSFSFLVKAGATVTVNGYPGYTSYTLSAGEFVSDTITDTTYTYTAEADVKIIITPVDGNNYFYSIGIAY